MAVYTIGTADDLIGLLNRHGPEVRQRIRKEIPRRFRSMIDEEDVMQETYIEVFVKFRTTDLASVSTFSPWLYRAAKNNLTDAIRGLNTARRDKHRVSSTGTARGLAEIVERVRASDTSPSERAVRRELPAALSHAVGELPVSYQRVITLCFLSEMSVPDVARQLECSQGAVFMRRSRALQAMQRILDSFSNHG